MINQTRQTSRTILANIVERITQIRNNRNSSGTVHIVKDEPCARYDNPDALHLVYQIGLVYDNTVALSIGLTEEVLQVKLFVIKKIESTAVINCQLCRWTLLLNEGRTIELIAYCSLNQTICHEKGRQLLYTPITRIQHVAGREQKTVCVYHLVPKEENGENENRKRSRR